MAEKLCSTCRWYDGCHHCDAPQNLTDTLPGAALVEGAPFKPDRRWISCAFMRGLGPLSAFLNRACGRQGRWYQPRDAAAAE